MSQKTEADRQQALAAKLTRMGVELEEMIRKAASMAAVQSLSEAKRHVREARHAIQASIEVKGG